MAPGSFHTRNNPFHTHVSDLFNRRPMLPRYKDIEVSIAGLDSAHWSARVSAMDGTIYFIHRETGLHQTSVPPGFADADPIEGKLDEDQDHDHDKDTMSDSKEDIDAGIGAAMVALTGQGDLSINEGPARGKRVINGVFGTDSEYLRYDTANGAQESTNNNADAASQADEDVKNEDDADIDF